MRRTRGSGPRTSGRRRARRPGQARGSAAVGSGLLAASSFGANSASDATTAPSRSPGESTVSILGFRGFGAAGAGAASRRGGSGAAGGKVSRDGLPSSSLESARFSNREYGFAGAGGGASPGSSLRGGASGAIAAGVCAARRGGGAGAAGAGAGGAEAAGAARPSHGTARTRATPDATSAPTVSVASRACELAKSVARSLPRRFAIDRATDRSALSPRAVTWNPRAPYSTSSICAIYMPACCIVRGRCNMTMRSRASRNGASVACQLSVKGLVAHFRKD